MTAPNNIIDFVSDDHLLGPFFRGESWDRWRAVLRAAFALPMTERDLALFREVAGDRAPPTRRVRELVCAVGRGGGKDSVAAALATFIAVTSDFTRLRPGEHAAVMCMAVDRQQASIAFNYVRGLFKGVPMLGLMLAEPPGGDSILLKNCAEIVVQTNNTRSPRGRTVAAAIYDECAHWYGVD
jgi:phage terminase large subunit-like protein